MSYENDDGTFDEDALFDEADYRHAQRKELDAADYFDNLRAAELLLAEHESEKAVGIDFDDLGRHVLIIEPSGLSYIAPHLDLGRHPFSECERVGVAMQAFRGDPEGTPFPMPAGRYWASCDDDGNLLVGSRLADA